MGKKRNNWKCTKYKVIHYNLERKKKEFEDFFRKETRITHVKERSEHL
jgi:hypothetical protein